MKMCSFGYMQDELEMQMCFTAIHTVTFIPEHESCTKEGTFFLFRGTKLEYKSRKNHYVGILLKAIKGKKMLEKNGKGACAKDSSLKLHLQ